MKKIAVNININIIDTIVDRIIRFSLNISNIQPSGYKPERKQTSKQTNNNGYRTETWNWKHI